MMFWISFPLTRGVSIDISIPPFFLASFERLLSLNGMGSYGDQSEGVSLSLSLLLSLAHCEKVLNLWVTTQKRVASGSHGDLGLTPLNISEGGGLQMGLLSEG